MADTVENKQEIREVIRLLSKKYGTELYEDTILQNYESRKYHGISKEKDMCVMVCTNSLVDGKIKAGQRSAVFEKCYWLTLSPLKKKMLVFTDEDFYKRFMDKYSDYLKGIEAVNFKRAVIF